MARQIARVPRPLEALEIGRCGDDRAFQFRPDLHRHHVGLQAFAEPYACVVSLLYDIGEAVFIGDFEDGVRIAPEKVAKARRQNEVGGKTRGGNAQFPGGAIARLRRPLQRLGNVVERRTQPLQQALSLLRGGDAARRAREETNAEARFQTAHGVADGRWRDAEFLRRAAEAAMGGDGGKDGQLGELCAVH